MSPAAALAADREAEAWAEGVDPQAAEDLRRARERTAKRSQRHGRHHVAAEDPCCFPGQLEARETLRMLEVGEPHAFVVAVRLIGLGRPLTGAERMRFMRVRRRLKNFLRDAGGGPCPYG